MEEGEKGRPVGDGDKKGLMKSRVLQAMQIRFKRDVTERCIGLSPKTEYIIIEGGCKLLRILLLFLYCFCFVFVLMCTTTRVQVILLFQVMCVTKFLLNQSLSSSQSTRNSSSPAHWLSPPRLPNHVTRLVSANANLYMIISSLPDTPSLRRSTEGGGGV